MGVCYVNRTIAAIYETSDKVVADEGLYGMPLLILEECGDWYKVRTHYSYEGYVAKCNVIFKEALGRQMVVNCRYVDVLSMPKVQSLPLVSLTVGCLIEVTEEVVDGYRKVVLLDGREGYLPDKYLMPKLFHTNAFCAEGTAADEALWKAYLSELLNTYFEGSEANFRQAVCDTALGYYMGTQYRWGGKTPLGIDCSGMTSMSYMLNGVLTYRDARIVEGYPVKAIPREQMKKCDLLYFAGHIALYLGNNLYIHSTARTGSNGVDINSFDSQNKQCYRKDLDEGLLKVGTIFW